MSEAGDLAPASGQSLVAEAVEWRRRPRVRSRTRLAQLRIKHGARQDELAALVGVSVPRYSGIENATLEVEWRWPTVEQAQALSEHFGEAVSELWPFLTIRPCGCGRDDCSELMLNGRVGCRGGRGRRTGPAELVCDGCGEPLGYRRPARIGERNWHRECYEAALHGAVLAATWRGYCEWRRRETGTTETWGRMAKLLAAAKGTKLGPGLKHVEAVHRKADEFRELKPGIAPDDLVDVLVVFFKGRDALKLADGTRRPRRDPKYRAARRWVERRLVVPCP
jgi:transcriptional regulator with XRE-family HTH domain